MLALWGSHAKTQTYCYESLQLLYYTQSGGSYRSKIRLFVDPYKGRPQHDRKATKRTFQHNEVTYLAAIYAPRVQRPYVVHDVRNPAHNHEPAPASTHPSLRRQELTAKAAQIEAQISLSAPTRQILFGIDRESQSSLKAQASSINDFVNAIDDSAMSALFHDKCTVQLSRVANISCRYTNYPP
jgi:hypothetical protein